MGTTESTMGKTLREAAESDDHEKWDTARSKSICDTF